MKKRIDTTTTRISVGHPAANRYDFRVRRTLQPGSKGTQRILNEFHEALYCVRHRDDQEHGMRYTTIELIRSVRPLRAKPGPFKLEDVVAIRTRENEHVLDRKLEQWGGTWDERQRCWLVPYKVARKLRVARRAQPRAGTSA
jgi:hypothetical protein